MKGEIVTTMRAVMRTAWGVGALMFGTGLALGGVLSWRAGLALGAAFVLWGAWRCDNTGTWRHANLRATQPPPAAPGAFTPPPPRGVTSWPCGFCGAVNAPTLPGCGGCGAARTR